LCHAAAGASCWASDYLNPDRPQADLYLPAIQAAVACAALVPPSLRLSVKLKSAVPIPFALRGAPAPTTVTALTLGLWVLGIVAGVLNHAPRP
jgi:hypothetical protein